MSLPRRNRPDFKQQFERGFARIQHPLCGVLSELLAGPSSPRRLRAIRGLPCALTGPNW